MRFILESEIEVEGEVKLGILREVIWVSLRIVGNEGGVGR